MRQRGLSVVAPIENGQVEALRKVLQKVRAEVIDEMKGKDTTKHLIRFEDTPTHFARLVLIDFDPGYPPVLFFGSNHDGNGDAYLDALIKASQRPSGENRLDAIWGKCKGYPAQGASDPQAFKKFINDHTVKNGTYYVCYPGITRKSVLNALKVFNTVSDFLDKKVDRDQSTEKIAAEIKGFVEGEMKAGRLEVMTESMPKMSILFRLLGGVISLLKPIMPILMVLFLVLLLLVPIFYPIIPVVAFLILIPILFLYLSLRRAEKSDRAEFKRTHTSNYLPSDLVLKQETLEAEIAQNQMTLINPLKPSRVRRFLLRVFLGVVDFLARRALNQGTLGDVRTVHFARWFYTDNGERLIFNSQFDESWQQYIGAFVDLLPVFLTGIWSNAIRYPPAKNFVFEGATDIESFMQYIREFQIPSDVFYSAYAKDSAQNIVNAVRMRTGLLKLLNGKRMNEPEREEWLRRFAGTIALPDQVYPERLKVRPEDPKVRDHLDDIQGWLLNGYTRAKHIGYIFLKITDPKKARKWLGEMAKITTRADQMGVSNPINIAFTAGGLEALGLPKDALLTFPTEFQQGIAQEYYEEEAEAPNGEPRSRSRKLGDTGESAPKEWVVGGPFHLFDVVLILHAGERETETAKLLDHAKEELAHIEEYKEGLEVVHTETGHRLIKKIKTLHREDKSIFIEHFGFRDGIAEPAIRDSEKHTGKHKKNQITIAAGEFVLGYRDQYDFFPPTPSVRNELDPDGLLQRTWRANARKDLGRNGTFVVFRKLSQNVHTFWKYFDEQTRDKNGNLDTDKMIKLASRSVGRWPNGVSLTLSPDEPAPRFVGPKIINDFLYVKNGDLHGYGCPFASHVRRSNPRDSLSTTGSLKIADRHHIIRRAAPYGPITDLPPWPETDQGKMPPFDDVDRGLMFFCLNTSFRRQFEFVQIAWNNSPRFNGLYNTTDAVIGPNPSDLKGDLALEAEPFRLRTQKCPRFTGVKGGAYLFLPSISALKFLAQLPGEPAS